MSNIVVAQSAKLAANLGIAGEGAELAQTLKATAFKGQVSDAQMAALLIVASQYRLNPWTKEIYAFPDRQNGIVPVVGVDGWARIINNHPQFDGMEFEQDGESCTCIMYRKDRSRPVKITEWMDECKRKDVSTGPWKSHPKRMLRHKSMIQCARMAFGFGGIYDQDEAERIAETAEPAIQPARHMGQADVVVDAPSPELIARAEAAAYQGDRGYRAFWASITPADRKTLTGEHKRLKGIATQVDESRTVDTSPAFPPMPEPEQPASKTFEEIMQMLCQAKTEEALFVAADWIAGDDQEQVKLLDAKFQERLAQIRSAA